MHFKFRIGERLAQWRQFLTADIWRIRGDTVKAEKLFWLTQLRILVLAVQKYYDDNCALRASALTFYSLLSMVPLAAMAFGVAKGFGLEKLLEAQVLARLS